MMQEDIRRYSLHMMESSAIKWIGILEREMAPHFERLVKGDITLSKFSLLAFGFLASAGLPEITSKKLMRAYEAKKMSEGYEHVFMIASQLQGVESDLERFILRRNQISKGIYDSKD